MDRRIGVLHAAIERAIAQAADVRSLTPLLVKRAAERLGMEASSEELDMLIASLIEALDKGSNTFNLDMDPPCSLGGDEAQVQANLDALFAELTRSMPAETEVLSDALSEAVQLALKDTAGSIAQTLRARAVDQLELLSSDQERRLEEVRRLWGDAFDTFDLLRHMVVEWYEAARQVGAGPFAKRSTALALGQLFTRAQELAGEISVLGRSGYADGALARWRSLHEVCVVAMFIAQRPDRCARMYLAHHKVEESHLAAPRLHLRSDADALRRERGKLVRRFGPAFKARDYGWAAVELNRGAVTFRDLERVVGLEKLRRAYARSSAAVHGGSLAALTRLTVGTDLAPKDHLPTPFGCEVAITYAVSSLSMLVAELNLHTEDADLLAMCMVIAEFASDVRAHVERGERAIRQTLRGGLASRAAVRRTKGQIRE